MNGRSWRCALIAVIVAGVVLFAWRGPGRAALGHGSTDFVLLYSSARAWVQGGNPYDGATVGRAWAEAGDPAMWHELFTSPVLLYPPSALAVMGPVAALPWGVAVVVWALINTTLAGLAIWAVARVGGLCGAALLGFLAVAVWLQPWASGVRLGQSSLVAAGAVCAGELLRARGWAVLGGVLIGVGAAVKPQMGLLFVAYEVGRLRWRVVAGAVGSTLLLFAVGAGRLAVAGTAWAESWLRQLHDFPLSGNADPSRANPVLRHQMINLHYPVHSIVDSREAVRWLVYAIVGGLCLAYFVIDRRRGRERGEVHGEVLSLSMVAVVSLMVVYHRFYDAVLLVWPAAGAAWAVAGDGASRCNRRTGWLMLALLTAFVVPASPVLVAALDQGKIPEWLAGATWWNLIVMPHEAWALLGLAVCLVWVRARVGGASGHDLPTPERRGTSSED